MLDAHGHATELELARHRIHLQDQPIPIEIGDDCWIGMNAIIMKGAIIGDGCIVAANSLILAGEYPSFSLLAGSPAKVVRQIQPEEAYPVNFPLADLNLDGKMIYNY